ncbi:MAG: hypothetical protein F6K41_02990 [Symploca sp. SIO3E6]|nr:hypothetical protein [Caldora sp. SIO3E6]
MPMNRKLYPKNWESIALEIKEAADWHCQECQRPCKRPSQSWDEFAEQLNGNAVHFGEDKWWSELFEYEEELGCELPKYRRFVLTVAHLDHDPSNCDRNNLKALCSVCHLRYDATEHAKKAASTRFRKKQQQLENSGQLKLFGN